MSEKTRKKKTIHNFQEMKDKGEKITFLTCYTYPDAQFSEEAGMDMLLVGDSLRMCVYGYPSTIKRLYTKIDPMDQMVAHTEAVTRGAPNTFVIGDMPFGSYQESTEKAIHNARRFFEEAGVDAIKLEGGKLILDKVKGILDAGMAVMGHIGLTPQTSNVRRESKVHGRTVEQAKDLVEDAKALEKTGVFSILLEAIPPEVGLVITKMCKIPVLGIGAGPYVDGQLLIIDDVLGRFTAFPIKFVKQYINLEAESVKAFRNYIMDIRDGLFPEEKHCYRMKQGQAEKLLKELASHIPPYVPPKREPDASERKVVGKLRDIIKSSS